MKMLVMMVILSFFHMEDSAVLGLVVTAITVNVHANNS